MNYLVTFDMGDVSPHDLGVWNMPCNDSNLKESVEALIMLGFKPEVEML